MPSRRSLALAGSIFGFALAANGASQTDDHLLLKPRYVLQFPRYVATPTRDSLGRVTSIKVTVRCGYIVGLSRIPADWAVDINREITANTSDGWKLEASAWHGATYLYRLDAWNDSITVAPYDQSCFDVTAAYVTEGDDGKAPPEYLLSRKQLKLKVR